MEYSTTLGGVALKLEITQYDKQYESDKAHIKVGYGKLTIADFAKVDLILMKEVAQDRLWLGLKKAKGEKFSSVYIPREHMDALSELINGNEIQEQTQDVPWEKVEI